MITICKADYGLEERIMFKPIVYANTIHRYIIVFMVLIIILIIIIIITIIMIIMIIVSMSLILHAVERLGIDLDSEESEYDAYVFYQVRWLALQSKTIITI